MNRDLPLQKLHVRLLKPSVKRVDQALEDTRSVNRYEFRGGFDFDGRLYVALPNQASPPWLAFVQTGIREKLQELTNRTNAAVLVIRHGDRVFAFTFGHGRYLLKSSVLVPDFGLKTVLNAVQHNSLRSLDSFVVEEQTIHTRAQASRATGIEAFGVDVSRDILRAVTGTPRVDIRLHSISGSESAVAVSARTDFAGLGKLCDVLLSLYRKRTYKEHFAWVDNVRRVSDLATLKELDDKLIRELQGGSARNVYLAPPEPIDWEDIQGFAYTRRRRLVDPDLQLESYLENTPTDDLTIDDLKRDRVFMFRNDEPSPTDQWQVYNCLVFETSIKNRTYVLTTGTWFEIDRDFAQRVQRILKSIPVASIRLPKIQVADNGKIESEGDYNARIADQDASIALLDKKLARCRSTSSPIELCDLLTRERDLIHVKHRKGGSSSLSHLFAQARISAEALLNDEEFRQDLRQKLGDEPDWQQLIPTSKPIPSDYRVILAILGTQKSQPGPELPFFSQLNLVRTYESLASIGYKVAVLGVGIA